MVFNIEISISILGFTSEIENRIIELGHKHHSISNYSFSEMENKNRNHIIYVFVFDDNSIKELEHFIREVRKIKNISIECLYEENITCKLIYASSYYLSTVDKDKVIMYHKRKRSYSEDESLLVNEIKCKSNKNCTVVIS